MCSLAKRFRGFEVTKQANPAICAETGLNAEGISSIKLHHLSFLTGPVTFGT